MDISLTPKELRDLLTPPLRIYAGPRPPLDLDAMTPNAVAGAINELTADDDRDGLTAQRTLIVTLADLAQAKEELARTSTLVEEKAEELRQLIENYGKVRQTPIMQANAVIENAGKQAHDIARIFFLETGNESWYQGVRATLKNLLDTLGVEVDEQLEEHLRPAEPTLEDQPNDGSPRPESHLDIGPTDEQVAAEAIDSDHRVIEAAERDAGRFVPPAGRPGGEMRTHCTTCREELRYYPEGWIDAETHTTGADGHAHDPDLSDVFCEHGLAADMHCCDCRRSGFFPPDGCTCGATVTATVENPNEVEDEINF